MVSSKKEVWMNWLEQSEADMDAAKYNFEGGKFFVAVFLCQQAIEKALKALWLKDGNDLVRTHNLIKLGRDAGLPEDFSPAIEKLTEGYVASRYDMIDDVISAKRYSSEEVDIFIKLVEEVLEWVKMKI